MIALGIIAIVVLCACLIVHWMGQEYGEGVE